MSSEDRSRRVPPVRATTVRFDDTTLAAVEAARRARGMNSASEYIRQAVAAYLAWDGALRILHASSNADLVADHETLMGVFEEVTRRVAGDRLGSDARP